MATETASVPIGLISPNPATGLPPRVLLVRGFRYVHGPLVTDTGPVPFLGDERALDGLGERIRHSDGGAFLVTGFRGTGKTTMVLRMLEKLASDSDSFEYFPIVLNVARPFTLEELLFEVVRRLFEALVDHHVLDALPPDVRRALILAYARTSLSFKETQSEATEQNSSLGLSASLPILRGLNPSLGFSRKRTNSMATEAAFLTYTHSDVEHDFLRILDLLSRSDAQPTSWLRRSVRRIRRRHRSGWRGRVVVVLDELDKLPADDPTVPDLLSGLKNILSTRNVHFIFVGGPDLHDAALLDATRGDSVYESVFAHQVYVPCIWQASYQLLNALVSEGQLTPPQFALLREYLDYKSRGVPRLLLQELNDLVHWDGDDGPYLHIDEAVLTRILLYARLQQAVSGFAGPTGDDDVFTLPIDRDRWRLGTYYITDWILRNRRRSFGASEIMSRHDGGPGAWLKLAVPDKVEGLCDHLAEQGILSVAWDRSSGTIIGDAPQERMYEVEATVLEQLSTLAQRSVRDRTDLATPQPDPENQDQARRISNPWLELDSLGTLADGRYELQEVIGRGGIGTVYRALDRQRHQVVAVKMLDERLTEDSIARARFRREADVATSLDHRGIVHTYAALDEPGVPLAIVMELIEGDSLRGLLPVSPRAAVAIAQDLLDALDYLAERGFVRVDMKPDNIIVKGNGHPIIVDLGIVKPTVEPTTRDRRRFETMAPLDNPVLVGTPAYMSPEQIRGDTLDIRSDLYALGLVLFEMLSGKQGVDGESGPRLLLKILQEDIDTSGLPGSPELKEVIATATARDREARFPSPAVMRAALGRTPEASADENGAADAVVNE